MSACARVDSPALRELFDWLVDATEADEEKRAHERAKLERVYTTTEGKFALSRAKAVSHVAAGAGSSESKPARRNLDV